MKGRDTIIMIIVVFVFIASFILLMEGHWIWAIILGLPSFFFLAIFIIEFMTPKNSNFRNSSSNNNTSYYTNGYNNLWLETKKGYTKYEMVGMYYRKLNASDIGKFEGYSKVETNNPYDSHAVAIYSDSGKHLGYLPSGNKTIHKLILDNGGILPAYGYISRDASESNHIGEVAIKTNLALNTDHLFYDQTIAIIGRFSLSQKDLSIELRRLGAYVSSNIHGQTNIVLIGENIKSTQMMDKLKFLLDEGYNIKTIYKDELETILNENKQL